MLGSCRRGEAVTPPVNVVTVITIPVLLTAISTLAKREVLGFGTRTFRVRLVDEVLQLRVVKELTHGVEDRADLECLYEPALGRVKHLERFAHD